MLSKNLFPVQMCKVCGTSMLPFLKEDSILLIKKVPPECLRFGDLLVFKNALGSTLVHRLVKKHLNSHNELIFRSKGDANRRLDQPFTYNDLIGKVFFVEIKTKSGKIKLLDLQTPLRRLLNFLVAVLSFAEIKILAVAKKISLATIIFH